ncbi:protein DGS1, mitochondrial [Tanacetum coccineum]
MLEIVMGRAMLELNQILRANEINFAILAAIPAFLLSLGVLMLLRAWVKHDTRAEGPGNFASKKCVIGRRILLNQLEYTLPQVKFLMSKSVYFSSKNQICGGQMAWEINTCIMLKTMVNVDGYGESDAWNHHFQFRKIQSEIGSPSDGRYMSEEAN